MSQAELKSPPQAVRLDSDRRRQMMQEAFDDVDQGRLVDHQDIVAWADRLSDDKPLPLPRR